jgi:hypothetical protein
MGEANEPKKTVLAQASEYAMAVDTMGSRVHVRWDETAQATPHGQIVFFAEFLATAERGAVVMAGDGTKAADRDALMRQLAV